MGAVRTLAVLAVFFTCPGICRLLSMAILRLVMVGVQRTYWPRRRRSQVIEISWILATLRVNLHSDCQLGNRSSACFNLTVACAGLRLLASRAKLLAYYAKIELNVL